MTSELYFYQRSIICILLMKIKSNWNSIDSRESIIWELNYHYEELHGKN